MLRRHTTTAVATAAAAAATAHHRLRTHSPSTGPLHPSLVLSAADRHAAMAGAQPGHLRLERRKANLHFASWRLAGGIARGEGAVPLPAPAVQPQAADTDYVTARHAALLNALTQQPRGCYTFLEGGSDGGGSGSGGTAAGELQLAQVDLGEPGQPPRVRAVCGER